MEIISTDQTAVVTTRLWTKKMFSTRNTLLERYWMNSCLRNARSAKDFNKFANLQNHLQTGRSGSFQKKSLRSWRSFTKNSEKKCMELIKS